MSFIAFDTEDNSADLMLAGKSGFDKEVLQIVAKTANGKLYYSKGDIAGFKAWLLKQPEQFIYAHNVAYDLGNIFPHELDALDKTMVGGRLIKAKWKGKVFLDTFNLWPMKLAKLGEAFGLAKGTFNARSKAYAMRDVDILLKALRFVHRFAKANGIERLPSTLGGLGLALWKGWGGENQHDSLNISREAYYGGRTEIFCSGGKGSIFYTDINSLYPYCMTKEFPVEMMPMKGIDEGKGVARVDINVPEQFIAPLPYRNKAGRIFYPTGKLTGVWTLDEIRNAIEFHGCSVLKVFEAFGSKEYSKPYADFVEKTYHERLRSKNEAEKLFWKLLMNTLYGRLALTGKITRSVKLTVDVLMRNDAVPYGSKALVTYQMPLDKTVNWSHGAYVTSYGRIELLRFMRQIGENLIYCDTDSVFFFAKELSFAVGKELGQMKLEKQLTDVAIYAPKAYRLGNEYKAKGVPRNLAVQFITEKRVEYNLPFRLREAIAYYDRGNAKRLSVWRKVEKRFSGEYDKKSFRKGLFFPLAINEVPCD